MAKRASSQTRQGNVAFFATPHMMPSFSIEPIHNLSGTPSSQYGRDDMAAVVDQAGIAAFAVSEGAPFSTATVSHAQFERPQAPLVRNVFERRAQTGQIAGLESCPR